MSNMSNSTTMTTTASNSSKKNSTYVDFILCFCALQCSYLVWGIMQEMIMNVKYTPSPLNPSGYFPSATFCVFSNRFLAILVACGVCYYMHGTVSSSAPFLAFTPCALSNTISSWSQYQALSFVSFGLQTLFKSTKVIPVMLMGKLLRNQSYCWSAYVEAVAITVGVVTFSMGRDHKSPQQSSEHGGGTSDFSGFILLSMYVLTDSFTSQWQSKLYSDYGKIDQYHMMFGVNASSILLTIGALLMSGELPQVFEFFAYNPSSFYYNVLTAITSTTGQIAIFYTIKRFGPIIFTVIMTTRQVLSIVISMVLFGHAATYQSLVGCCLVFVAVFHSISRQRTEELEKEKEKERARNAAASGISASSPLIASAGDNKC